MRVKQVITIFAILLLWSIVMGCDNQVTIPAGPFVDATVSRQSGPSPLSVGFNATVANAPSNYQLIWYFGDDSDPEAGLAVSHVYLEPGDYTATVTLVAITEEGTMNLAADWVHISAYAQAGPPTIP